jgi:methanogenic corrinoid protein MtbC1
MGKSNLWEKTAEAIETQRVKIARAAVAEQYKRQPEIWESFGDQGRKLSERDAEYHLPFLSEALSSLEPRIWNDYVEWVQGLFANLDFPPEVLPVMIDSFQKAIQKTLPSEQAACASEILEKSRTQLTLNPEVKKSHLDIQSPLHALTGSYLDLLLKGERHKASQMILAAAEDGIPIRDIYLEVFQTAQREIGRLWYTGEISVAHEHYASATTQFIMAQLYPYVLSSGKNNRRLVSACAQGELHEIGLRIVTDFFEIEGWDTYYLGANQPVTGVVQVLEEFQTDVLAISASMIFHRRYVSQVIEGVKAAFPQDSIKIIVGGNLFNHYPDLCKKMGADGYAHDAQDAVKLVNTLLTTKTPE